MNNIRIGFAALFRSRSVNWFKRKGHLIMAKIKMVICIGSACFAKGNAENMKVTEKFLADRGLSDEVDIDLCGGLCSGNCADGPIVYVNDKIHKHVDRKAMQELLENCFPQSGSK